MAITLSHIQRDIRTVAGPDSGNSVRKQPFFCWTGATLQRSAGFTLLELLVAMAMAALILAGVYRVVAGSVNGQHLLEQRQEQLHQWLYLRRLLHRDLEQRLESTSGDALVFGLEEGSAGSHTGVTVRCAGGVVPGRILGPTVEVRYLWERNADGTGMSWGRELRAAESGRMEPGLNIHFTEGLEGVSFAVLDQDGWKKVDEALRRPLLAVRWQFDWSLLGQWTLVQRLQR